MSKESYTLDDLNYIKGGLSDFYTETEEYPLGSEDIRTSYLELAYTILVQYYRQWCSLFAAKIIKDKRIGVTLNEKSILEVFVGGATDKDSFYSMRNGINRNLFVDSWSTFEFSITYMCESLFDKQTKDLLLKYDYIGVEDIITRYNIINKDKQLLEKRLLKHHLTHISVNRKYEKVYSLFKSNYRGDWKYDASFLGFFGKYRNSMHTNYIYHGNDIEYEFLGIKHFFENGEPVRHNKEMGIKEMFDLAIELKNVCRRLFDAVQYDGLLPYPADKIPQP